MDEMIMVVDSKRIEERFGVDSSRVIHAKESECIDYINRNHFFVSRLDAERNMLYKQIVSYCLITCGEDVFLTKRTVKQTEERLHNRYSVGVGGHINFTDESCDDAVISGMLRELSEEVNIGCEYTYSFGGIINDNSSEVNSVHAGLCFIIHLREKKCYVKETEKMYGMWINISKVKEYMDGLELWSKILLNSYSGGHR